MFENRVLRKIVGPKRDEVTGEWRKLHNEEFHALYSSLNIVLVIKSIRMRWRGIQRGWERRKVCISFWWGNIWERDHWGEPGIDGKIILEWIFRR
jgi:hypothetical protein